MCGECGSFQRPICNVRFILEICGLLICQINGGARIRYGVLENISKLSKRAEGVKTNGDQKFGKVKKSAIFSVKKQNIDKTLSQSIAGTLFMYKDGSFLTRSRLASLL